MRIKSVFILSLFVLLPSFLLSQVHVRGYFRKNGTYVQPHVRTAPDGNPYNNYSFPGNYNPNTGETTKGNPNTYLENYYNKKPAITPPDNSLYFPESNEASYGNTDPLPPIDYQTYRAHMDKINDNYNVLQNYQTALNEIDELIKELVLLKERINNKSSTFIQSTLINGAYYIVIFSETEEAIAKNRMRDFMKNTLFNKYKCSLSNATVNGRQWFRVALGEFDNCQKAKNELAGLAGQIPADSWIVKY